MKDLNVVILGVPGTLLEALVQLLEERAFPLAQLHLVAADADADAALGTLEFRGRHLRWSRIADLNWSAIDLGFVLQGEAPMSAQGANMAWVHLQPDRLSTHPRILPGVTAVDRLQEAGPHLANPVPAAIVTGLLLAPLLALGTITRVQVVGCLSVCHRAAGVKELARQTGELLNGLGASHPGYSEQMAFNLWTACEPPDASGQTSQEKAAVLDLRQVLPVLVDTPVEVSLLQAPVFFGDALHLQVLFESPLSDATYAELCASWPGVERVVDTGELGVLQATGDDNIRVCRVIRDASGRSLRLLVVFDPLRKASALNAVQMAEQLIKANG